MNATGVLLRLAAGALLTLLLANAVAAPEAPRIAAAAAVVVASLTLASPFAGLLSTLVLASVAGLLATAPVHAAEMFAVAFLAGWLLPVWRPLSPSAWPAAITLPAVAYALAITGSWLQLTLGGAAGVSIPALAPFLLQQIPSDYLIFSSPEAETRALLQNLTGLGLLLAAVGIGTRDERRRQWLSWTLVGTAALVGVITLGEVIRQWASAAYEPAFLLRYFRGERFAVQMSDLNAAGSWFVIPLVTAASVVLLDRRGRWPMAAAIALMVPAFWLIDSRTAYLSAALGIAIAWLIRRRTEFGRRHLAIAAAALLTIGLVAALAADWNSDDRGTAGLSLRLRSEFLATSARMFASAPLLGVGIGRYFDRSSEFMSDDLRAIYGNENAHNYAAQQLAEIGVVGGLMFIWLIVAVVRGGAASLRSGDRLGVRLGLFSGLAGYLLTCLAGHPLLVAEAALPFWIVAGAVGGGPVSDHAGVRRPLLALASAAIVIVAAGTSNAAWRATTANEPPREYGFHQPEFDDGRSFRWMTSHAVSYVPNGDGFLRIQVRAHDQITTRPVVLETALAGRVIDRREIPADRWVTFDLPARASAPQPFQRVDFRVNQWWTQEVSLGRRTARRPIAAKLAELRWIPLSDAVR